MGVLGIGHQEERLAYGGSVFEKFPGVFVVERRVAAFAKFCGLNIIIPEKFRPWSQVFVLGHDSVEVTGRMELLL